MPEPTALALARLRAAGHGPRPGSAAELASWRAAASRAGRRLCEVNVPEQAPQLALGWLIGSEPGTDAETGVRHTPPSQVLLLTFAAALRACWIDRSEHPFPGVPTDEETVLAAVAVLGPLSRTAVDGGEGGLRHRKGALRRLREAGVLAWSGARLRLGPVVATWTDAQVATVRAVYDQLPAIEVAP